mmetsp:Transcript_1260/g.4469  ORF Transcript_1260/g.4469 Transcript_1260/m.4469 type:complete len:818 (-) Transcript_1260:275-2728(-)
MSTVENWSNSSSYALASQVAAPIELGTDTEFATWSFWLFASESYHGKLFELQSGGDKTTTVLSLDSKQRFLLATDGGSSKKTSCVLPVGKWILMRLQLSNSALSLTVDGSVVETTASTLLGAVKDAESKKLTLNGCAGSKDLLWTCGLVSQPSSSAEDEKEVMASGTPLILGLNNDALQDLEVSTTAEHEEAAGMEEQTMFVVVGGKASCRRKFTMEVVVKDANGEIVRNGVCDDMVLVADLRFATSGRPLLSDAEPALLTTFDGVEYCSTARPTRVKDGIANFKFTISRLSSKCGNQLFSIRFRLTEASLKEGSSVKFETFPGFLQTKTRPILSVSRKRMPQSRAKMEENSMGYKGMPGVPPFQQMHAHHGEEALARMRNDDPNLQSTLDLYTSLVNGVNPQGFHNAGSQSLQLESLLTGNANKRKLTEVENAYMGHDPSKVAALQLAAAAQGDSVFKRPPPRFNSGLRYKTAEDLGMTKSSGLEASADRNGRGVQAEEDEVAKVLEVEKDGQPVLPLAEKLIREAQAIYVRRAQAGTLQSFSNDEEPMASIRAEIERCLLARVGALAKAVDLAEAQLRQAQERVATLSAESSKLNQIAANVLYLARQHLQVYVNPPGNEAFYHFLSIVYHFDAICSKRLGSAPPTLPAGMVLTPDQGSPAISSATDAGKTDQGAAAAAAAVATIAQMNELQRNSMLVNAQPPLDLKEQSLQSSQAAQMLLGSLGTNPGMPGVYKPQLATPHLGVVQPSTPVTLGGFVAQHSPSALDPLAPTLQPPRARPEDTVRETFLNLSSPSTSTGLQPESLPLQWLARKTTT